MSWPIQTTYANGQVGYTYNLKDGSSVEILRDDEFHYSAVGDASSSDQADLGFLHSIVELHTNDNYSYLTGGVLAAMSKIGGDDARVKAFEGVAASLQNYANNLNSGMVRENAARALVKDIAVKLGEKESELMRYVSPQVASQVSSSFGTLSSAANAEAAAARISGWAGSIRGNYDNVGYAFASAQILSALADGSTNEVLKACVGTLSGMLVAAMLPASLPLAAALIIGVGAGLVVNTLWDNFVAPYTKDLGNFWDNLFSYLGVGADSPEIPNFFDMARNWIRRIDPLALDLDGDGIEVVAASAGIQFDHDGDGVKTGTGWVKSDDGILVYDRNGNGVIDNGSELFGDYSPGAGSDNSSGVTAGLRALRALDSNGDNVFDAADTSFSSVRVWRDLNQDGVSQANELFTLAEVNVKSINLMATSTAVESVGLGNLSDTRGDFTRTDGSLGVFHDLQLANNNFYRDYADHVLLTDKAKSVANLQGSGQVRDLQEAASLDDTLADALLALVPGMTQEEMRSRIDGIVEKWAGTSTLVSTRDRLGQAVNLQQFRVTKRNGDGTDYAKIIGILERFNGSTFFLDAGNGSLRVGNTTYTPTTTTGSDGQTLTSYDIALEPGAVDLLMQSYNALKESVYSGLVLQTRLKNYTNDLDIDLQNGRLHVDVGRLTQHLAQVYSGSPAVALRDTFEFIHYGQAMLGNSARELQSTLEQWVHDSTLTSDGRQHLREAGFRLVGDAITESNSNGWVIGDDGDNSPLGGTLGDDWLFGFAGADVISGNAGADSLLGGDGGDVLYGNEGDDLLVGGTGNDTLRGGYGSDVYRFSKGDGVDMIDEEDANTPTATDIVEFTDVASTEVSGFIRDGDDLVLNYGAIDSVRINQYYYYAFSRIEQFKFSDGVVWDTAEIAKRISGTAADDWKLVGWTNLANVIHGLAGNDTLSGGNLADILYGDEGNDRLTGNADNDALYGGDGADTLYGNDGNDMLVGGIGNDTLMGGYGSDVYRFSKGDGVDTIDEEDANTPTATDIVEFTDVASTEVSGFIRDGDDLVLQYGSGDSVRVSQYYYYAFSRIEQFKFSDGVVWDTEELAKRISGTAADDWKLVGWTGLANIIHGLAGNDTLSGGNLADTLYGDEGNDSLTGNADNDVLYGGDGADTLYGNEGDDLLVGGAGNDTLKGGYGSDTYRFSKGDGADTIDEEDANTPTATDIVEFTDVASTEVAGFERSGDDLVLRYGASDSVIVRNYYYSVVSKIEKFKFSDGVVWDATMIAKMQVGTQGADTISAASGMESIIHGLGGNDTLNGADRNDILYGDDGDDRLVGNDGNDTLAGGVGNDTLYGGIGDDLLVGGAGNDSLQGSNGSDTYRFSKGDGVDTITGENDSGSLSAIDIVEFTNVASTEVSGFERNGYNLVLRYGPSDVLTVQDYYYSAYSRVEQFKFSDGVIWDIGAIAQRVSGTAGADTFTGWDTLPNVIHGLGGNDQLTGGSKADTLYGDDGDDKLVGNDGNDTLAGGVGNDTLYGGIGDDLLIGGLGNDSLQGSNGSDTYRFSKGDGVDTITGENDSGSLSAIDVVEFTDVASTEISGFERNGYNLVLRYGTSDAVTVQDYYYSPYYRVEQFKFSDGVVWDIGAIAQRISGTASADTFTGWSSLANTMHGLGGNDQLTGGSQADALYGDDGDDALNGGAGNDTLDGGTGTDTLTGGTGNDTYLMGRGYGADSVVESDSAAGNFDVASFLSGIAYDQLWFERPASTNDLKITIIGTADTLTIKSWYSGSSYQVEQIRTADGYTLSAGNVQALVSKMATMAKPTATTLTADQHMTLDSTFASTWVAPSQGLMASSTSVRTAVTPDMQHIEAPRGLQSTVILKHKKGGNSYLSHKLQDGPGGQFLFDMLEFDSDDSPLRNMRRSSFETGPSYHALQSFTGTGLSGANDLKLLTDAMATFDGRIVGEAINDFEKVNGAMSRQFFASERLSKFEAAN